MSPWTGSALVLAALGSGLMGGVFFAFSNSVMTALGRLPALQGMAAMNDINVIIVNPVFMVVFMGTAILALTLGGFALFRLGEVGSWLMLLAAIAYLVGAFGVTMAVNVPLNDALAAGSHGAGSAALWQDYLKSWTGWNHVRMVASIVASAVFIVAAMVA